MQRNFEDPANLDHALSMAQEKLDRFERKVLNQRVLVRLRASSPFHPFLLFRTLSLLLAALAVTATIAIMAAPLISRELAVQVGQLDAMFSLPLPAVGGLLAGGFFLFTLCAHLAAHVAGRSAPLLPGEARTHQRLTSDVKRLEAQLAVSARITPSPAGPRAEAYR